MDSKKKFVNVALALYQAIVVCAVVNQHDLVADEKHLVWVGLPIFVLGFFSMPRISTNWFSMLIFMLGVYVFGGKAIFFYSLGGFLAICFMYKTLNEDNKPQLVHQNSITENDKISDKWHEDLMYQNQFSSIHSDHPINVYYND